MPQNKKSAFDLPEFPVGRDEELGIILGNKQDAELIRDLGNTKIIPSKVKSSSSAFDLPPESEFNQIVTKATPPLSQAGAREIEGKTIGGVPRSNIPAGGAYYSQLPDRDTIIDWLARPLSAAFTSRIPIAGKYVAPALDVGLQMLKEKPTTSLTQQVTGMEPGSLPTAVTGTAEGYGLGYGASKLAQLGGKGYALGKALFGKGSQLPPGMQSIMELEPTTGQALTKISDPYAPSLTARIANFIENNFAYSTKREALRRTAENLESKALDIGYKLGWNFTRDELKNPNLLLNRMANDLPPEMIKTPIRRVRQTREVQPLERLGSREEPFTKFMPKGAYSKFKPGETVERQFGRPQTVGGAPIKKNFLSDIDSIEALDDFFNKPNKVESALTRGQELGTPNTNPRKDMAAVWFRRIWQRNTSQNKFDSSKVDIDVQGMRNDLLGSKGTNFGETSKKLFGDKGLAEIDDFITNAAILQNAPDKPGKFIRFLPGVGGMTIGGGLSHILGMSPVTSAGVGTGVVLGMNQIGKLLTKTNAAKILTNMVAGRPLNIPPEYAFRILAQAMNGMTVSDESGERQGSIKNGKFVESPQ